MRYLLIICRSRVTINGRNTSFVYGHAHVLAPAAATRLSAVKHPCLAPMRPVAEVSQHQHPCHCLHCLPPPQRPGVSLLLSPASCLRTSLAKLMPLRSRPWARTNSLPKPAAAHSWYRDSSSRWSPWTCGQPQQQRHSIHHRLGKASRQAALWL